MISPKELRLGNYATRVFDSTKSPNDTEIIKIAGINSITKTYVCEDDCIGGLNELQPVPLTEEILLKCGFKRSSSKTARLGMLKHNSFDLKGGSGYGSVFTYGTCVFNHIIYLHQLQNLYFALTNKEIEVKL